MSPVNSQPSRKTFPVSPGWRQTGHDLWPARDNFAGLADRDLVSLVVDTFHFGRGKRHADGAGLRACSGITRQDRRGFGEAVAFDHLGSSDLPPARGHHFLQSHPAGKR